MKTLLIALALLISCGPLAHAACEPTTISGVPYYTDADSVGAGLAFQGFDFHAGRLFGRCPLGCLVVANVAGSDTYRIEGAPAGTAIPIRIDLHLHVMDDWTGSSGICTAHCSQHWGDCNASIHGPQGAGDSLSLCFCGETTRSIGIDLSVMPDEEFRVGYFVYQQSGSIFDDPGSIEATVIMSGVPPGAHLTSCHGVDEQAVATKPLTWGSLKATYR